MNYLKREMCFLKIGNQSEIVDHGRSIKFFEKESFKCNECPHSEMFYLDHDIPV